jgi:hypothetical protein
VGPPTDDTALGADRSAARRVSRPVDPDSTQGVSEVAPTLAHVLALAPRYTTRLSGPVDASR